MFSGVPPGSGHSMFFLGGGNSILIAAVCGSAASSACEAMIGMRSPWIFVFVPVKSSQSVRERPVSQPDASAATRAIASGARIRERIMAWLLGLELAQPVLQPRVRQANLAR